MQSFVEVPQTSLSIISNSLSFPPPSLPAARSLYAALGLPLENRDGRARTMKTSSEPV